jgi:hypothetical protein
MLPVRLSIVSFLFSLTKGCRFSLDRDYFIRNLHDALSGYHSQSIEESIAYSENAVTKCIGTSIISRCLGTDYYVNTVSFDTGLLCFERPPLGRLCQKCLLLTVTSPDRLYIYLYI